MDQRERLFEKLEWVIRVNPDPDEFLNGEDRFVAQAMQIPTALAYGRTCEAAQTGAAEIARLYLSDMIEQDPAGTERLFAMVQMNVRVPAHVRDSIADQASRAKVSMGVLIARRCMGGADERPAPTTEEMDRMLADLQQRLVRIEQQMVLSPAKPDGD